MLRWLIGIILGEIICESSNWQHIQRLKITILGANWQLFSLERTTKCSYFILSTHNIKFHWIVMKIKKFMLPIWWYNRDLFPFRNKYNVVLVLNGLKDLEIRSSRSDNAKQQNSMKCYIVDATSVTLLDVFLFFFTHEQWEMVKTWRETHFC